MSSGWSLATSVDPAAGDLAVVHHEPDFVVVTKPAGLLSVPGSRPERRDSAEIRLKRDFPTLRLVHRLDRDTSGLMVFALNYPAQREMHRFFRERRITKHYQALVDGLVSRDEGEIDLPLGPDWPRRPRQQVDHSTGKSARTLYHVLERNADTHRTRVLLIPVTGRTHQLRLHMQALGHPIPGCDLYAPPRVRAASERLLLHACGLGFPHPRTGAPVWFSAEPPFR